MLLQDRLADLTLRSKLREMDLDRERIKVRIELRNSRKKNIDIRDAAALGMATNPFTNESINAQTQQNVKKPATRKHAVSAPPGGRLSVISENHAIAAPSSGLLRQRKRSSVTRFGREASLPEIHESLEENEDEVSDIIPLKEPPKKDIPKDRSRTNSIVDESVGAYVLGEFRRMSQVVPSILMALSRKDEEEEDVLYQPDEEREIIPLLDYEPDLHRVTKTVSAVKKLRHRMSVSKKLEACRSTKSLDQMIREKTENLGVQDEFTDGTCVLMKRRLDKKRRNSATPGLSQPPFMQRRQSLFAKPETHDGNKTKPADIFGGTNSQRPRNRSQSIYSLPRMSRSPSVTGFGLFKSGLEEESDSPVIDEDKFINRQKVLREIENYQKISAKVDQFLSAHKSRRAEYEDIVDIK